MYHTEKKNESMDQTFMQRLFCCPVCGKRFIAESGLWAYKGYIRRGKDSKYRVLFCSWGCLRENKRQRAALIESRRAAKKAAYAASKAEKKRKQEEI